jgi:hypothetical protein
MKHALDRVSALSTIVATGLLVLASATAHADDRGPRPCSNATVKGTYGFYRTGPGLNGPVTAVGHVTFDGHGNLTLVQDVVRNGEPSFDETGSGTYRVDPDCRAHGYDEDGNEISRSIIVDDGNTYYFISVTGNNVYGVATKIGDR